jgi:hypothetical protein
MPSFICDVVPAVFRSMGVDVRYYPIGEEFAPDYQAAARVVDPDTKALLGVHFFGFPQPVEPMRRFCDERGLALIEDNAHGLLTEVDGRPLGGAGDLAVVSIRKTLALPTGGALLVNDAALAAKLAAAEPRGRRPAAALFVRFAGRTLLRNVELAAGAPFVATAKARLRPSTRSNGSADTTVVPDRELLRWWRVSEHLASHFDLDAIRRQRRDRFKRWLERIAADPAAPRPVFSELPPGVVPLALPVEVTSAAAAGWVSAMRSRGVEVFPWPDLPTDSPERRWRGRVFTLPLTADVRGR